MEIHLDQSICEQTGFCVRIAPKVFGFEGEKVVVLDPSSDAVDADLLREAEQLCPTGAITLTG
jgi:ferredoxin